ncbi:alpha/beta hydrolase fold domain-containing protein [Gulosibacter sp. 10]|uniref:alpha/beta hydrolase fold domain-containing protein n=1 Tax=Gulosibacter sp. 10 TaxID=1255570 RepID=UPI000B35DFCC|nr:alpha/beta hydrolase fold domain-containing protein [Gulosibacter sp. 10]
MTMITTPATTPAETIASDGSRVPLLVHRPREPRGWLVWAHGGSWQFGSAAQWAPITAALAARSGWAVASVEYRLAPTHRFPAAVLDVLAALEWADARANSLPVVGGDSAGGTIASLAALTRRDAGQPVPPQVLAYPPFDPDCASPSYSAIPGAFPSAADLRAAWRQWLGRDPDAGLGLPATPLRAATLAGLTPVTLVVGEHDPVRDDVRAYACRLRSDRVRTSIATVADAGHADLLRPGSPVLTAVMAALAEPALAAPTGAGPTPPPKPPPGPAARPT